MLWGLAFSYLIFGEVPGLSSFIIVGGLIVIAAGIFRSSSASASSDWNAAASQDGRRGSPPAEDSLERGGYSSAGTAELQEESFRSLRTDPRPEIRGTSNAHVDFLPAGCAETLFLPLVLAATGAFAQEREFDRSRDTAEPRSRHGAGRTSRWHMAASGHLMLGWAGFG